MCKAQTVTISICEDLMSYTEQIFQGWYIKFPLAILTGWLTNHLQIDVTVFCIFLSFWLVNLLVGAGTAALAGLFDKWKVYKSCGELLLSVGILVLFGYFSLALTRSFPLIESVPIANMILCGFIFTDVFSILHSVEKYTNIKLPPFIKVMVKAAKRKTANDIANAMGMPDMVEKIDKALGPDSNLVIVRRRAGDTDDTGVMQRAEFKGANHENEPD